MNSDLADSLVVGVSDMKISNRIHDILTTYSLGSCLGLSLYDPVARVGGLIHCMLPLSSMAAEKGKENPFLFVDTGVPALIQAVFDLGGQRKRLQAKAAGCGNVLDQEGFFRIGEKNYTVLRRVLWRNKIPIAGEDVGGTISRTMSLVLATGQAVIRSQGEVREI
jgi:chemotaxis protein CheD